DAPERVMASLIAGEGERLHRPHEIEGHVVWARRQPRGRVARERAVAVHEHPHHVGIAEDMVDAVLVLEWRRVRIVEFRVPREVGRLRWAPPLELPFGHVFATEASSCALLIFPVGVIGIVSIWITVRLGKLRPSCSSAQRTSDGGSHAPSTRVTYAIGR